MLSAVDVADVVSRAATDSSLRGQVLEIAGEPITMTELARGLQNARGWHGSRRHLPRVALRTLSVLAHPISPAFARQNRTTLAMDTGTLSFSGPAACQSWPSRQALPAVLAGFTTS